jgi:hypothetical protein
MMRWRLAVLYVIAAVTLVAAGPARSNGDTFFNPTEIPGNAQYVIFGNVKDTAGHYLSHATVTAYVVQHMLAVTTQTNVIGRFRTPDVGREIEDLGYRVDPSLISVSVEYPGYHIAHRQYHGKYRQNKGAIEINFIMQQNGSK